MKKEQVYFIGGQYVCSKFCKDDTKPSAEEEEEVDEIIEV